VGQGRYSHGGKGKIVMSNPTQPERRDGFVEKTLPPNDWSFAEKVRTLRNLHKLSQTELASRTAEFLPKGMRISRRGISGLESVNDPEFSWPNGTYVHPLHIIALAKALGVPAEYLDPSLVEDEDVRSLRALLDAVDLTVEDSPRFRTYRADPNSRWSMTLPGQGGDSLCYS
jgi:transcriptional regulator with XRE-family HTH domain